LFGKAKAVAGSKVLVHGATGAVGIATCQLALSAGMQVWASSGSYAGTALLHKQGVESIISHREASHMLPFQAPGKGFDVIIEMLANENLAMDMKALNQGGVIAVVGNKGDVSICPRDLMVRDASIVGVSLNNIKSNELKQISQALYPLLGKMLCPVVRRVYPLEELGKAQDDVLQAGALGNLVLKVAWDM